jgi:hypothetical protein
MNARTFFRAGAIQILAIIVGIWTPLASLRAQSVFSVNALGYVDASFVSGSNLIANPFFTGDNTVSNLFRGVPDGTAFLPWDRGTAAFGPTNRYTAANGWTAPGTTLVAPDGGFLVLPSATKVSFVGQPWMFIPGPMCLTYPAGESVWSSIPLASCGIIGDGIPDGLSLFKWVPQMQHYNLYTYFFGQWDPSEPQLASFESALFSSPNSFSARAPFLGSLGGGSPVPTGLPWVDLQNPQRSGNNLTFRWPGTSNVNYAVFCSTNLDTVLWQLVQQGAIAPSGGFATVTISSTNSRAFYRVLPGFGDSTVLLGGHRVATTFGFQFYAPVATNYTVERAINLSAPSWQSVTNVSAGPSNIVSVVDITATGASGYYRIRY